MTAADHEPNLELARRFAALVLLVSEQPASALEHREAARAVLEAARRGPVTFTHRDGVLLADDAPMESPFLGQRFAAYGLESLGITPKAAQADLLDLARLLAAPPGEGDPPARFASRAAAVDPKALPRTLRPRLDAPPPEPLPMAQPRYTPRSSKALTPSMNAAIPLVVDPAAASAVAIEEAPSVESDSVTEVLPLPTPSHHALATAIDAIELADAPAKLAEALDQFAQTVDLAFRQGRWDDLVEAVTAFIAVEFAQLRRDPSDEVRQAFNHTVRRLAKPVLLRQLATLRHERAGDTVAGARLQQALRRLGRDGAEAMLDAHASAPTIAARATCLESLRGLRRTFDALAAHLKDPREAVVRQAAVILGELRDLRGEPLLVELLQHPDAGVRRAAVSSLALFDTRSALDAIGFALNDESTLVRQRAVVALGVRPQPEVLRVLRPLLDKEPDREVLYAAIGALATVATPEAVATLAKIAAGEGVHPQRRSAGMRIQACIALVTIRTPAAMAAVQGLRDDRDREVREASVRLVAQAARRSTSSIRAIPG